MRHTGLVFVIGGGSRVKQAAVAHVLEELGMDACLELAPDVRSGVSEQPVGAAEIEEGSYNRSRLAQESFAAMHEAAVTWCSERIIVVGVGIENGIELVSDESTGVSGWYDSAYVTLRVGNQTSGAWTRRVRMPDEYVDAANERGFRTTTVGQIIAERHPGVKADDPHSWLTNGVDSRVGLITDALRRALGKMTLPLEEAVLGEYVRQLPVKEVAPGVHASVFDLSGDWEAAERLGCHLALKMLSQIPGIDALVMPEGKATALLHVLARESRLPSFVARKQAKAYMGPTCSATYRSITTDKEQSLHLSEGHALFLRHKRVVIVDDVVSTGGTIEACKALMEKVGATVIGVAAVFTEGERRPDVVSLGHLELRIDDAKEQA